MSPTVLSVNCHTTFCVNIIFNSDMLVPLQWSEWTNWTDCSKSCGGGTEERKRQCVSPNAYNSSEFVHLDSSDCVGDQAEIRPCNVLPCQVGCPLSFYYHNFLDRLPSGYLYYIGLQVQLAMYIICRYFRLRTHPFYSVNLNNKCL